MSYVILSDCVDTTDRSCIEECPVDCIYVGSRKAYIHPGECIDCGACELACPVEAIRPLRQVNDEPDLLFARDNAAFFAEPLPGRDQPLGTPGGAAKLGDVGADTALVQSQPHEVEA